MRACLLLCAALALAASRPRAAAAHRPAPPAPLAHNAHNAHSAQHGHPSLAPALEPARLHHIKTQILAKLGLTSRPTPLGAPPRDVVRQILARAADPTPERRPEPEHSMREIIAIAHRGLTSELHALGAVTTIISRYGIELFAVSINFFLKLSHRVYRRLETREDNEGKLNLMLIQ